MEVEMEVEVSFRRKGKGLESRLGIGNTILIHLQSSERVNYENISRD